MIPRECKRLAEVDFPIAEVSKHSAREKSIRHGHPSTLHLWWARRPLAACRAMLMALLLPDPCDQACPDEFRVAARTALAKTWHKLGPENEDLRAALLKFIADFANWDKAADSSYLESARMLIKAAYTIEQPLIVDTFAGGGSIPLEAIRLDCDAFASELNPVACLILQVLIEDIPRVGATLTEPFLRAASEVKRGVSEVMKEYYPADGDGSTPIAYIWARTVRCEKPSCGREIPLVRSFWLSKKTSPRWALRYTMGKNSEGSLELVFEAFNPKNDSEVPSGTVKLGKATCPSCNTTLPPPRVKAQLRKNRGGTDTIVDGSGGRIDGATLLAVVLSNPEQSGRRYRAATNKDYATVQRAAETLEKRTVAESAWLPDGIIPTPTMVEHTPGSSYFNFAPIVNYGMTRWQDLFTARQKFLLSELAKQIARFDAGTSESAPIKRLLMIMLDRVADYSSCICRWHVTRQLVANTFGRQALPMTWDFCESVPLGNGPGNLDGAVNWIAQIIQRFPHGASTGRVQAADACESPLPSESAHVWFVDPPYYDSIPYSYISDFFFIWLKAVTEQDAGFAGLRTALTPKDQEIIETLQLLRGFPKGKAKAAGIPIKDKADFEHRMARAFLEGRRLLHEDGIGCIVFAHKTTEGWEALLSGIVRAGLVITASWPIATEMGERLRARDSAALATSVHLVCRPRGTDQTGDWGTVLRELPKRVGEWMNRLEREGIRGADLVFACIGPALEIFSRYERVESPDGAEKTLAEYLEKVWEVVGRVALEQVLGTPEAQARNGGAGALEEDARLTALFLWTIQATDEEAEKSAEDEEDEPSEEEDEADTSGKKKPGFNLIYDVARRFAQPLGIHLSEWEGRIVETKKGVVRLLPVRERSQQLFGDAGADLAAERIERVARGAEQLDLFSAAGLVEAGVPEIAPKRGRKKGGVADDALKTRREATTLDRVHAAMLLQASGRANALRSLLKSETERSPDFLRLANALSALYPKESEEKRLLDAMLLAAPR